MGERLYLCRRGLKYLGLILQRCGLVEGTPDNEASSGVVATSNRKPPLRDNFIRLYWSRDAPYSHALKRCWRNRRSIGLRAAANAARSGRARNHGLLRPKRNERPQASIPQPEATPEQPT
jgi:hypothetical protein